MSKLEFLIIVFVGLGIVFFSVSYWLIGIELTRSIKLTTTSAIGGIGAMVIVNYLERRKRNKNQNNKTPL